jgi:RNA polymerase sigma-70 factor (ECF subfamily)
MLGSLSEADDALQDAWLRVRRADAGEVENVHGWLTTIVARVCLNMLRSRRARREESLEARLPDPVVTPAPAADPEHEVLLADSVGLALLIVLDTLSPAERLAFVLHDLFAVPFDEVARILGRTPAAARQLASRARRRVRGATTSSGVDRRRQREVVDAFLAASRGGDFEALLAILDPEVVVRIDYGPVPGRRTVIRGARTAAGRAIGFARLARFARPVLVNGDPGLVVAPPRGVYAVLGFTIRGARIVEIDILADAARLRRLDLPVELGGRTSPAEAGLTSS